MIFGVGDLLMKAVKVTWLNVRWARGVGPGGFADSSGELREDLAGLKQNRTSHGLVQRDHTLQESFIFVMGIEERNPKLDPEGCPGRPEGQHVMFKQR